MSSASGEGAVFVVKVGDLLHLDKLVPDEPEPVSIDWIDLVTNRKLPDKSVKLLLRTLFDDDVGPSELALRQLVGMRFSFRNEADRDRFAAAFERARRQLNTL